MRWKLRSLIGGLDGVQDMLLPNMAPWHIENFKLKEVEKTAEAGRSL